MIAQFRQFQYQVLGFLGVNFLLAYTHQSRLKILNVSDTSWGLLLSDHRRTEVHDVACSCSGVSRLLFDWLVIVLSKDGHLEFATTGPDNIAVLQFAFCNLAAV